MPGFLVSEPVPRRFPPLAAKVSGVHHTSRRLPVKINLSGRFPDQAIWVRSRRVEMNPPHRDRVYGSRQLSSLAANSPERPPCGPYGKGRRTEPESLRRFGFVRAEIHERHYRNTAQASSSIAFTPTIQAPALGSFDHDVGAGIRHPQPRQPRTSRIRVLGSFVAVLGPGTPALPAPTAPPDWLRSRAFLRGCSRRSWSRMPRESYLYRRIVKEPDGASGLSHTFIDIRFMARNEQEPVPSRDKAMGFLLATLIRHFKYTSGESTPWA